MQKIKEIEVGKTYYSKSGVKFNVLAVAKHGQCCSESMIIYINLGDTVDTKAGGLWTIPESIFLNRMYEKDCL